MKIQLLSDLHLESHPHFVPEAAPGADLLVLAGDIGSYQSGSLLRDPDFGALFALAWLADAGVVPARQPRIRRAGLRSCP